MKENNLTKDDLIALNGILNFDYNKKLTHLKSVYSFVFEQVLLLHRYTIDQAVNGDRDSNWTFTHKLALISAVRQVGFQCGNFHFYLDNGIGAIGLINHLRQSKDPKAAELIELMEHNAIMFPTSDEKHPYPFSMMQAIISNPIGVYQRFLELPPIEELVYICIYEFNRLVEAALEQRRPRNIKPRSMRGFKRAREIFIKHPDIAVEANKIVKSIGDGKIMRNKDHLSSFVESSLYQILMTWAEHVFSDLTAMTQPTGDLFRNLLNTDELVSKEILKVSSSALKRICLLGHADRVGSLIAQQLEIHYREYITPENKSKANRSGPLLELSKWYKATRTKLKTEPQQIASSIASLVIHHVEKCEDYYDCSIETYKMLTKVDKASVLNKQKLATALINAYLYHYREADRFLDTHNLLSEDAKEPLSITEYMNKLNESASVQTLNPLMEEWHDYNNKGDKTKEEKEKTIRNRFKRPIGDFKASENLASEYVKQQQNSSLKNPFPLDFPLPLWAHQSIDPVPQWKREQLKG